MEIKCMEPISINNVVTGNDFVHQIKWDGIRGVVHINNGNITIQSKNGNICTSVYPELITLADQIDAKEAVLDGEMVVFKNGKPSFKNVLKRNSSRNKERIKKNASQNPIKYIVFDILYINKNDLRNIKLEERQDIIKTVFTNSSVAALTENFANGEELFKTMKLHNMEGIVSKRLSSTYIEGKKHNDWFKTKISKKMLCVVIGANKKHGNISSIILGIYQDNILKNIGSTYSGLSDNDLSLLNKYMNKMRANETEDIIYIKPKLTCWIRYTEWNTNGSLRHPVLIGFSSNKASEATGKEIIL